MSEAWKSFKSIPDKPGLTEKEQIQYWKYSYHQAMTMFEECADNHLEQLAFYREVVKGLRAQVKELHADARRKEVV